MNKVKLINFDIKGGLNGQLIAYEKNTGIDFEIKRVYSVTKVPKNSIRGYHAHKKTKQLLVCLNGEIEVMCENKAGEKEIYTISNNGLALYTEELVYHTVKYLADNTILMVLADLAYDENDYLRDYEEFKKYESSI